ncbi:antirestriction protein [Salmonella enterica]|nr:antirestriction protein [Salmonella enterica]
MTDTTDYTPVTASLVPEDSRMGFYPAAFGKARMMRGEALVLGYMGKLCQEYKGAFWHFYTLSNGGYYMAPAIDAEMHLEVSGNWFSGSMSADAAGIVATLFALGHLAAEAQGTAEGDALIDRYHFLREYALDHSEAAAILGAID